MPTTCSCRSTSRRWSASTTEASRRRTATGSIPAASTARERATRGGSRGRRGSGSRSWGRTSSRRCRSSRRGSPQRIGPFDTELEVAEDWDFWLRAIYSGRRITLQPKPLALYRRGTGLSVDERRMDEHGDAVLRKALARDDLTSEERAYVKRRLAGPGPAELGRKGDEALRARDYRAAAR